MNKRKRAKDIIALVIVLLFVIFALVGVGSLVYIANHFLMKYW